MSALPVIEVAVAVIERDRDILIARRPDHVHQGGLWEFPGGKLEAGESVTEALAREINEELSLQVEQSEPLLIIEHDYGDKSVRLLVQRVLAFAGEPVGAERQEVRWVPLAELDSYEFPAANAPIIPAIREALNGRDVR